MNQPTLKGFLLVYRYICVGGAGIQEYIWQQPTLTTWYEIILYGRHDFNHWLICDHDQIANEYLKSKGCSP